MTSLRQKPPLAHLQNLDVQRLGREDRFRPISDAGNGRIRVTRLVSLEASIDPFTDVSPPRALAPDKPACTKSRAALKVMNSDAMAERLTISRAVVPR